MIKTQDTTIEAIFSTVDSAAYEQLHFDLKQFILGRLSTASLDEHAHRDEFAEFLCWIFLVHNHIRLVYLENGVRDPIKPQDSLAGLPAVSQVTVPVLQKFVESIPLETSSQATLHSLLDSFLAGVSPETITESSNLNTAEMDNLTKELGQSLFFTKISNVRSLIHSDLFFIPLRKFLLYIQAVCVNYYGKVSNEAVELKELWEKAIQPYSGLTTALQLLSLENTQDAETYLRLYLTVVLKDKHAAEHYYYFIEALLHMANERLRQDPETALVTDQGINEKLMSRINALFRGWQGAALYFAPRKVIPDRVREHNGWIKPGKETTES